MYSPPNNMLSFCPQCATHLNIHVPARDAHGAAVDPRQQQQDTRKKRPHDPAAKPSTANPRSPKEPKPSPKRGSKWTDPPHSLRPAVDSNPPKKLANNPPPPTPDATTTTITTNPSKKGDNSKNNNHSTEKKNPAPADPTRDDRRRLKRLICLCPCPDHHHHPPQPPPAHGGESADLLTFRIYLCSGAVGMLEDGRAEAALDRAARKMLRTIRHDHGLCGGGSGGSGKMGAGTPDQLLAARRQGSKTSGPAASFGVERVFQFLGAIVYDMEWTGAERRGFRDAEALADVARTMPPRFALREGYARFATEMLRVDYGLPASRLFRVWYTEDEAENLMWSFERFSGFVTAAAWRWREGRGLPDQRAWDLILDVLASIAGPEEKYWTWDHAIMFYYYYTRRQPVSAEARRQGWTGYTGVLHEMVAEVPTRGRERLQRKLSMDIHASIPSFVKYDTRLREQMIATAWDLAARHGCEIAPPPLAKAAAPEKSTPSWPGWLGLLF